MTFKQEQDEREEIARKIIDRFNLAVEDLISGGHGVPADSPSEKDKKEQIELFPGAWV